jgi:TetR/AcrR family transcriptional regulator
MIDSLIVHWPPDFEVRAGMRSLLPQNPGIWQAKFQRTCLWGCEMIKQGRIHNAEGARQAILDAAEATFAEVGFDGARIVTIARASSYNSGLIFHYFGDKLGLYAEVIKRADQAMAVLQAHTLAPLLDESIDFSNSASFKALLEKVVALNFDYLVDHPRFTQILLWEQAGEWQTFSKIFQQFETGSSNQVDMLFGTARRAGLLRSDFPALVQMSMVLQVCMSFLAFIPLYRIALNSSEDFSAALAAQRGREYIIAFVVHAMMVDLPEQIDKTGSKGASDESD